MSRKLVRWLVTANLLVLVVFVVLAGISLAAARSAGAGLETRDAPGLLDTIKQQFARLLAPRDPSGDPSALDLLNGPGMARIAVCRNNLRMIHMAKMTLAVEYGKAEGSPISANDIDHYFPEGFSKARCPAGGSYSINAVGAKPTCSAKGHTLDAP